MSDELDVRLEDLQPDEIQELLAEEGIEATEEQIKLITSFVAAVGGLENAQGLFDELRQLRPAA
jgi:tryptophan synthase beta subunit